MGEAGVKVVELVEMSLKKELQKKTCIQVSNTKKPLLLYLNLAKRYIKQHNDVQLSALGMAIPTVVTIAEILKTNGVAVQKMITEVLTSTVGLKDENKGRLVHKPKNDKLPTCIDATAKPMLETDETKVAESENTDSGKSDTKAAESGKSKIKAAESDKSVTKAAESGNSETKAAESGKSETKAAESVKSETKAAESVKSETKAAESGKGETKAAELAKPRQPNQTIAKPRQPNRKRAKPRQPNRKRAKPRQPNQTRAQPRQPNQTSTTKADESDKSETEASVGKREREASLCYLVSTSFVISYS